jgi:hypothetical protein
MARTLTSAQEAERVKDGVKGVWMVVSTFDQYGASTTTKRWASRPYTLSSNTYEGIIAERGIDLGMLRVKEQGGLGPVATSTIRLRDEGGESTITDTHVISNDEVYVYFIFPTGSEVESDRIEVFRGVIERNSTRKQRLDVTPKGRQQGRAKTDTKQASRPGNVSVRLFTRRSDTRSIRKP